MVVGCAFTRVGDKVSKRASDYAFFCVFVFCHLILFLRSFCELLLGFFSCELNGKVLSMKCSSLLRHLVVLLFRNSSSPGRGRYSTSLHRSLGCHCVVKESDILTIITGVLCEKSFFGIQSHTPIPEHLPQVPSHTKAFISSVAGVINEVVYKCRGEGMQQLTLHVQVCSRARRLLPVHWRTMTVNRHSVCQSGQSA